VTNYLPIHVPISKNAVQGTKVLMLSQNEPSRGGFSHGLHKNNLMSMFLDAIPEPWIPISGSRVPIPGSGDVVQMLKNHVSTFRYFDPGSKDVIPVFFDPKQGCPQVK